MQCLTLIKVQLVRYGRPELKGKLQVVYYLPGRFVFWKTLADSARVCKIQESNDSVHIVPIVKHE